MAEKLQAKQKNGPHSAFKSSRQFEGLNQKQLGSLAIGASSCFFNRIISGQNIEKWQQR